MGTQQLTETQARRWTRVGALSAVGMVLGYLETFLPIPIPGIKLGLANIAVLVALSQGDVWGACWVAVTKVLAAGLLFGSPLTMAYSAAGTALSLLLMAPLSQLPTMRLWMTSVIGALGHVAGQLVVAQVILGTPLVWYGAPLLLSVGAVTGAFCGVIAERSVRLLEDRPEERVEVPLATPAVAPLPSRSGTGHVNPRAGLLVLVLFSLLTLRLSDVAPLACCVAASALACICVRVSPRAAVRALVPALPLCAITFVAQFLTNAQGDPLVAAEVSSLRLVALILANLAFARSQSVDEVLQAVQWLLAPLERLGVQTQGLLHALDVALTVLPLLASGVGAQGRSLSTLPQFVAHSCHLAETLAQEK